ncbi:glucose-6-phosphate isomerase [Cellulomonas sp. ATA003]|uniref:glucose-6-phosphate isomerase n=1 Tax=Cellulomonas sp. ATA003 TaxID=3073064 RepID=UPI002872AD61|nr:glucose-6-phosphate isomerase [Cellulomonas sp. ATA003]WNB87476.1 glucose-6-phosphate isomerase [Cellulomonas sp. ATA003]
MLEVTAAGAAARAVAAHAPTLVADRVASRIAGHDATLWGPEAEEESAKRLGWTDLHTTTREILPELEALRAGLAAEGIDRVVLAGMGGSSLAPEVITRTAGVPLVVLDSTDPGQVRAALEGDLARTVIVVSSKSGGTVETDSQRRVFETAFTEAGLDATRHIVVVTDPGSPLEQSARDAGYRAVFLADPNVGGRFSALSAFGVVPSALAGVDVGELLDEAAAVAELLAEDAESNPAVVLGAALGGTSPLRDKLVIVDEGSGIVGLGDWAEQLIAESTGKNGTGLLPVVTTSPAAEPPELASPADDVLAVRLVAMADEPEGDDDAQVAAPGDEVTVAGPLGAQMLLWEYATAIAGRLLEINPFDQPDVESAKIAARGMLDATPEPEPAAFSDDGIEVRATPGLVDGVQDVEGALAALLGTLGDRGYLAVMAYLDREAHSDLAGVRDALAARTGRPVTFGWGPRFLHSTGQLHKGGAPIGVYLQITGDAGTDLEVPDRPFTFGRLIAAQAAGDATVLADHGRPVLRLHVTDPAALSRLATLLGAGADA